MEGWLDQVQVMDSRRFQLSLRRMADGFLYGVDRSPYVGSGLEYRQSRPYLFGDSVRSIDWRVTARTRRVHVKEYEATKRMPCYLLLDTSASMTLGATALTKYVLALQIAGGLALAAIDRAMPVGILGLGERELRQQPSLSRDRVMAWLHQLRKYRVDEATQLASRVADLGSRLSSRALIVVLSDLHEKAALGSLKLLSQRHDCVVLQFRDITERGLRGAGLMLLREAETGATYLTQGRSVGVDQDRVDRDLKRSHIDHLIIDTDRPFTHRLRSFFRNRDVLGRGAR
jgi:uncharacterized protein (DUF58 family)